MTTPISDAGAPQAQPRAESFLDWFHVNSRYVAMGAAAVAIALLGAWYVQRKSLNESISADRKLATAKQSLGTGNLPLAESDLSKVADQYASKPSGAEAGLLLGQLRIGKGDYAGAVTGLRSLAEKIGDGPAAAQARALMGDALLQGAKPAEAAVEYEAAAARTKMSNEKSFFQAKAARAYSVAGRNPEAKRIWQALADQSDNEALATEARVRIGELSATGAM
ncbi:MAG: tetratricopeptide repeat protein [Gemmatimonadaceae bacterium]|nr:tetratricopeptide repeat protein [Gemmatimonadaceae bacterium]